MASPLLERGAETEALQNVLRSAIRGEGRVAVIEGAAGLGKTTLVEAAVQRARNSGLQVLRASGSVVETSLPFGVVRQLFAPILTAPTGSVSGTAARAAVVLGLHRSGAAGISEPAAASDALYWLTADLAADDPLLVLVDDAHWADLPSLRFLLHLARRIADHPIALVVATRPVDPNPLLEVAELVLRPGPLSVDGVGALVEAALGPVAAGVVEACARVTEGNAFLLGELLRALTGTAPTVADVEAAAPDGVRRRVVAVLGDLPGDAGRLAGAVAVLGEAELSVAAALAGLEPDAAADAALALQTADLLTGDRVLRFTHPLVAGVVTALEPEALVSAAHARAAHLLEDASAAAAHLLAVQPAGDPWAVAVLRDAAATASDQGAPEAAAAYLERALAEPPAPGELAPLLLATGTAHTKNRDFEPAVATLQRGLGADPSAATRSALGQALSQAHYLAGAYEPAADALKAITVAERDPARRLVLEANRVSLDLLDPARHPEASRTLEGHRAAAGRGELTEPAMLAMLGATSILASRPREEGLGWIRQARDAGLTAFGDHAFAYGWAMVALDAADGAEEGQALIDAAVVETRRRGDVSMTAYLLMYSARFEYRSGRLAEAMAAGHAQLDLLRGLGQSSTFPYGLLDVLIARAEVEEAQRLAAQIPGGGSPQTEAMADLMRGRVRAATGGDAETLALLVSAGERLDALDLRHGQFAPWRALAAPIALRLGQRDVAEALAAEDVRLAEASGTPTAIAQALRVRGLVHDDLDDMRAAVAALDGSHDGLELATTLVVFGATLRAAGRDGEARAPLERGLAVAHASGALALVERARAELLAAGGSPLPVAVRGADVLSASELQVARHVAAGLSDREIAEAQFVTVRSVELHVTQVCLKLGVDGRSAIAGALA